MKHGIITSVNYERGVVLCDVQLVDQIDDDRENLPVVRPHSGIIGVPKEGQLVSVGELDDGTEFVRNVIAKEQATPSDLSDGDLAIQLDAETFLTLTETTSGKYEVKLSSSDKLRATSEKKIEVVAEENIEVTGKERIDIKADSTVTIDSDATIELGTGDRGVITDISTTTDADGHVTDITLERSSKTYTE